MMSRRTTRHLAAVYENLFTSTHQVAFAGGGRSSYATVEPNQFYDFLFEHDYAPWICNQAKELNQKRSILEWVMRMHTGEMLVKGTPSWTWEQRQALGQKHLKDLAEDYMQMYEGEEGWRKNSLKAERDELAKHLELDGFVYQAPHLLAPEEDTLDTRAEDGVLESLYKTLSLGEQETAFHHLALSEEHYTNGLWDDCISNARKFLECVLAQVAGSYGRSRGRPVPANVMTRPVNIRDYLEQEGLLEPKEKEALAKIYGLLSETGGHPYMARNDQARLLRHMALTFSQFAMLRLKGAQSHK